MWNTNLSTTQKINDFKVDIVRSHQKELLNYFMKDENKMMKFMSWIVYSIQKIPSLLNDRDSLISAILELAQLWIAPGITQESYILPYKQKATAVIGYQGFVWLLYKAWITSVYAEIVKEKDVFKNILWTDPKLIHEVDSKLSKENRWKTIWCYVVVKMNGESIYKYMNIDDILEFRNFSQSYKWKWKEYSPWNEKNDPEDNMKKKTVLKQMMKYLPKNEILAKAVELDNKESPVNWTKEVMTWWESDQEKAKKALENLKPNNENDAK